MHFTVENKVLQFSEDENGLHIKAIAVSEGEHNGITILSNELKNAVDTFKNKDILSSHNTDNVKDIVGKILDSTFEENKIIIDALIFDDYTAKLIKDGIVSSVSIGAYADLERKDKKIIAKNIKGDHVALVRHPADPDAKIIMVYSDKEKEMINMFAEPIIEEKIENAKWDKKYINDLPDAAFAYIEPCYGKSTDNKNARHLPHHNANVKNPNENSSVDIPHLRNALARVNQIKPVCQNTNRETAIKKAKAHLLKHAKALLKTYNAEDIETDENLKAINDMVINMDYEEKIENMKKEYEEKILALEAKIKEYEEKEIAAFRDEVKNLLEKANMDIPENFTEMGKDELMNLKLKALEQYAEKLEEEKKVNPVRIKEESKDKAGFNIIFKNLRRD